MFRKLLCVTAAACLFAGVANAQQAEFKEGVLTAFTNVEGKAHLCRVHFSPDGKNLGGGEVVYEGISPVVCMMPYKGAMQRR